MINNSPGTITFTPLLFCFHNVILFKPPDYSDLRIDSTKTTGKSQANKMKKLKNCPGNNQICEYLLTLRGEEDRKFVPGVVRAPGIVEDYFNGATATGAAEINTLIEVVGPGGNYLPVPMSCMSLYCVIPHISYLF